jgi:hypothetical protein
LLGAPSQVPHLQWLVRSALPAHHISYPVYTMALREVGRSTLLVTLSPSALCRQCKHLLHVMVEEQARWKQEYCGPAVNSCHPLPYLLEYLPILHICPRRVIVPGATPPAINNPQIEFTHFNNLVFEEPSSASNWKSTSVVPSCGTWHINLPIPPCTCNVGHYPAIPLISSTSCNNVLIVLPNDRRYEIFKLLQRIHGPHLWSSPRILHIPVHSITEHLKLFLAFPPKSTNIDCKKLCH